MIFEFSDQDRVMCIHNYDVNGLYTESGEELIEAYTGLPALSTIQPLPDMRDDQCAIFNEGENCWIVINDNRGKIAYAKSREAGQDYEITVISEIPDTHTLLQPGEFDSWIDGHWRYDLERYRPKLVKQEQEWQASMLNSVEQAIANHLRDRVIPEMYSELRVTNFSEMQYYDLLMDRKLLNEYLLQQDFPHCGRPKLSGIIEGVK